MHTAGLPDLARENAEYITTNCKGAFLFELATGQDQYVSVKKEPNMNREGGNDLEIRRQHVPGWG